MELSDKVLETIGNVALLVAASMYLFGVFFYIGAMVCVMLGFLK